MNSSSSSRVGSACMAPNAVQASAPAAVPRRTASETADSSSGHPGCSERWVNVEARNASPAPVASTTSSI